MTRYKAVPQSRLARFGRLGLLAGGIAGSALSSSLRQLGRGQRPQLTSTVMTPANATRLAKQLGDMRGAAMKLGQLLSMDSGDLLPPQLTEILSTLRNQASAMPLGQVASVLDSAWGAGWDRQFRYFNFQPLASASIGQVHEATLKDGRHLAIKIQYPGIRSSIDADLDNVATLLSWSGLLPPELDLQPLLTVARQQLHDEADYRLEAQFQRRFSCLLSDSPELRIADVAEDLTTATTLAMTFLDGQPIETVAQCPVAERNRVARRLLTLTLQELFQWQLVQSDPNFANFLYQPDSGQLQLLDFGATRSIDRPLVASLASLMAAAERQDHTGLHAAALQLGYLNQRDSADYQNTVCQLLMLACEPLHCADYDFGNSTLSQRLADVTLTLRLQQQAGRLPPPDILFLHRKLAGLYLLFSRLHVRLPVAAIVQPFITNATSGAVN